MARLAFENGVTKLNAANLNTLLQMQDGAMVCSGGILMDSKTGAGVAENSLAENFYAIRITAAGQTEIGFVKLKVDKDGEGQDLDVELRGTGFNPDGTDNGNLLAVRKVPKEFINTTAGMVLVPIAMDGLTAGANYWLIINKAGDAANKLDLVGEATQDAAHPVYRRSGAGAWSLSTAIHFEVWSWTDSGDILAYCDGGAWDWLEYYENGAISKVKTYIPGTTGPGLRETLSFPEGNTKKWSVT